MGPNERSPRGGARHRRQLGARPRRGSRVALRSRELGGDGAVLHGAPVARHDCGRPTPTPRVRGRVRVRPSYACDGRRRRARSAERLPRTPTHEGRDATANDRHASDRHGGVRGLAAKGPRVLARQARVIPSAEAPCINARIGTTAVGIPVAGMSYAVGGEYGLSAIAIRYRAGTDSGCPSAPGSPPVPGE